MAANCNTIDTFIGCLAGTIVNPLIQLLFAAALVMFLWGVFGYIRNADNPEGRQTGGRHILWGLIGMAIMVGVYGIIRILIKTFLTG